MGVGFVEKHLSQIFEIVNEKFLNEKKKTLFKRPVLILIYSSLL